PYHNDAVHTEIQDLAHRLALHLAPKTNAYHEIWLRDLESGEDEYLGGSNGHVHSNGHAAEVEPIYGNTYLPRKFKIAVGLPGDNCIDMYANDLALMAICRDYKIVGYNVL